MNYLINSDPNQKNYQKIYLLGFLAHLLAALYSVGYHNPDEYFQIIEFASYKLNITSAIELPWEFHEKIRPSFQPILFFQLHKLLNFFGVSNHFTITLIFKILHAFLAFVSTTWLIRLLINRFKESRIKLLFLFTSLLLWFIPYFHARHSAENLASSFFVIAICVWLTHFTTKKLFKYALIGLLMGLAFQAKYQMGIMIFGFCLWLLLIQKERFSFSVILTIAFLFVLLLGTLLDSWFYNGNVFTPLNYVKSNFIDNKLNYFGSSPWYYYFTEVLVAGIPPISITLIFSFCWFWIKEKKNFLTWITLPYFAIHLLIAHKELRFLFPLLPFVPFVLCSFLSYLLTSKYQNYKLVKLLFQPTFYKFIFALNLGALLFVALKPANDSYYFLKFCYERYNKEEVIMLYKEHNPYSELSTLSYYKSPLVNIVSVDSLNTSQVYKKLVIYVEDFIEQDEIIVNGKKYKKIYSTWPKWFNNLNVNNWLSRTNNANLFERVD